MSRKGTFASLGLGIVALSGLLLVSAVSAGPAQKLAPEQATEDFFQAMQAGDTKSALQILAANTNLAHAAYYGTKLPLHMATSKGQLEIVEALLKLGADVNAEGDTWDTGNHKLTALEVAVWYNHPAVVKRLLAARANSNHLSSVEGSALHFAFNFNHEDMAGLLLDHGANPFLIGGNPYRKTAPFEVAITRSGGRLVPRMLTDSRVISSQVKPGADLLKQATLAPLNKQAAEYLATNGTRLLAVAAQRGELEAVEALLGAGVSARGKTPEGLSLLQAFALSQAQVARTKDFPSERWARIRKLLEDHGAVCDAFAATGLGDLETARRLVSADKNLAHATDHAGDTPLHWAVRTDRLPFTSFWLEAGALPAATNYAGQTALHLAAAKGLAEHVTRLLAAHAPTGAHDTNSLTPLDAAIHAQQTATIRLLLITNVPSATTARGVTTPLHEAAASGNIVALAALMSSTNIEARNELGFTPLHLAMQNGQLGAAALLLDRGADIDARDAEGNTALLRIASNWGYSIAERPSAGWFARRKQSSEKAARLSALTAEADDGWSRSLVQAAGFLLAGGADGAATNHAGKSAAQLVMEFPTSAFIQERTALLKLFGYTGVSMEERDGNGDTALHRAARDIWGDKVADLIAAGANVNATNHLGRTPLHTVVEKLGMWGDEGTPLLELLKAKPNVNAHDHNGLTPLHVLARSDSSFKKEATRTFLDAGADPNVRDAQGRTPAHLFLPGKWPWAETGECISMLLGAGADPAPVDAHGQTPLHYFAALGNQSPVFFLHLPTNFLSSPKLDVQARDGHGDTPLHVAARSGTKDVFDWLVKRGASLDATNNAGETPRQLAARNTDRLSGFRFNADTDIFQAVRQGKLESVVSLLKSDPGLLNRTNEIGQTPLNLAAMMRQTNVVELLEKQGAPWDAGSAARLGRADMLRKIIKDRPDAATKPVFGRSPLHLAAESGVVAAAEILVSAGAELNARDNAGLSPLGRARLKQRNEMADFLRQRGAAESVFDAVFLDDASRLTALLAQNKSLGRSTNTFGLAAVHLAAALGKDAIVKALIDKGVPADSPTARGGATPLHAAAVCNRANIAALLLRHGAKVDPIDDDGNTPLHLAAV